MTSCASCGFESSSTARFCAECGLPLLSPSAAGADVLADNDGSQWLSSTRSAESSAARRPGVRRGGYHPMLVAGAGLVLALLLWALFRAPTVDVEDVGRNLAEAADPTPSTIAPTDSATSEGDDGHDDDDENDDGSTDNEVALIESVVGVENLDPALADYDLYASGRRRLVKVDLGTGETEVHMVSGDLVGAYGNRLYLTGSEATLSSVPIVEPEVGPLIHVPASEPGTETFGVIMTSDGIVHIHTGIFDGSQPRFSLTRVNLGTGTERIVESPRWSVFGILEVPGAGLFEVTDNGFRFLADGAIRFYGERLVLVETCVDPDSCRRYWLDRTTGDEVDRPIPDAAFGYGIGATSRVLASEGDPAAMLVDGTTGRALPIDADFLIGSSLDGISQAITSDDRFLALPGGDGRGQVLIFDLDRQVAVTLDLPDTYATRVVFVPKSAG